MGWILINKRKEIGPGATGRKCISRTDKEAETTAEEVAAVT